MAYDREKQRIRCAKWREKNKERNRLYQREWARENALWRNKERRDIVEKFPERSILHNIFNRCHNPNNHDFKNYGGRGIKCFFTKASEIVEAIGPRPSKLYSVDRINNDGHYDAGNIRWATAKQQRANSRLPLRQTSHLKSSSHPIL